MMNSISDILADKADEFDMPAPPHAAAHAYHESVGMDSSDDVDVQSNRLPTSSESSEAEPPIDIPSLKQAVERMQEQLSAISRILSGHRSVAPHPISHNSAVTSFETETQSASQQIVEGVFDGQHMIGPDGATYPVPPNYASKSKLVEGDLMKLTISPSGKYIFKQIAQTERKHATGELMRDDDTAGWYVFADGHKYKILTASATFYKGRVGDHVTMLVPAGAQGSWGAVEHIMHRA